jgi:hypothetical protein
MERENKIKCIKQEETVYQFINMDTLNDEQLDEMVKKIKTQKEIIDTKIIPLVQQLKKECLRLGFSFGSVSIHDVPLGCMKSMGAKAVMKERQKDQQYFVCHLLDENVILFGNPEVEMKYKY